MTLEQLAKKTKWIQGACIGIRNFYENRPPYPELTYARTSFMYLMTKAERGIEKIKLEILR